MDEEVGVMNDNQETNQNVLLDLNATNNVKNNSIRELRDSVQPKVTLTEVDETTGIEPGPIQSVPFPNAKRFYPGDVVIKKTEEIKNYAEWQPIFGTVLKAAPGSDMAKNADKGSSTEFHVHWDFGNRIASTKESEVALVDRILLRGQRVLSDDGVVGTVLDYKVSATVQINGTNYIVERVPLQRLRPISPHVRGQEVLLNGWVGVVTTIKRNVWFRMDGGMIFYMETTESDGFTRTDPYWGLGVACPGMRTKLPTPAMKKAIWISGPLKFLSRWLPIHYLYSWAYSTIVRTEVTGLEVRWLQPVQGTPNPETGPAPKTTISRIELRQLLIIGTPSTETIGINSVRKLNILPNDNMTYYDTWIEGFKKEFIDGSDFRYTSVKPNAILPLSALGTRDEETPVKVLLRHNIVSVQWENGSIESIPAIKIPRISPTMDEGEFPMGLVIAPIQKDSANGDKYGIILESNEFAKARSRKVNVRWIINGNDEGVHDVSVFDIKPHNSYSMYIRGTIVFPRDSTTVNFPSGVVTDVNVRKGKMVIIRSSDNLQDEVYPHQVSALGKRSHWSFFSRTWVLDELVLPPYQLQLDYDPSKKMVDVAEHNFSVLNDVNNPQDQSNFATLWDEPSFELLGFAPTTHRYYNSYQSENFGLAFGKKIGYELTNLKERVNVPEGIWIRCYENRLDLISVLMVGPIKTPYEDGLFLFDLQLPADFPSSKPKVHYVSYTLELHPLLSFDGNVCLGLVEWEFSELQEAPYSYISLFLNRLQALIFTPDPFFSDEPKKQEPNAERGRFKSRMYNQGVFVRVMDSAWNMLQTPHEPWEKNIRNHFASLVPEKISSIEKWINCSDEQSLEACDDDDFPSYPLLPIPEGMRIAVQKRIEMFHKLVRNVEKIVPVVEIQSVTDNTADSESHAVAQQSPNNANMARCLTPIAEITEPSSTSLFGGKQSNANMSVPQVPLHDPEHPSSLDSLKNIKQHDKHLSSTPEEAETEMTLPQEAMQNR